ncbi:hypothetical protein HAV21_20600 [Paenarthrobacter sp. MSM-2-10-13]|nr:hypothetical protein [Paenarthrobacter sp. MSM-2-10-13]NKR13824.1 hypothetical protein [Arthrobacter sp. M5]NKR18569.1 hypothetical protein [Arthrobacter sp. M6]QMU84447.1 hypothetical protein FV140_01740 [Paenarthrobacter ureafaciens]
MELPLTKRRPGKLMLIPVGLLLSIAMSLGYLALTAPPRTSTPLGASSLYPGGMARISAIAPLENDGWLPPERGEALYQEPAIGTHRVRLLVELTALEPGGLEFTSPDFTVTGIGSRNVQPLWSSVDSTIGQGKTLEATLVFELPDQAIALVLEGPDGTRLSLGQAHHGK